MSFKLTDVSPEYIKDCFDYEDGKLYWRVRPESHISECSKVIQNNKMYAGKQAGYFCKRTDSLRPEFGYWLCRLNGGLFKVHRIIFYMHKGYLPRIIDHIDGDTQNNRIENLREANLSGNGANSKKQVGSIRSMYKGVTLVTGRPGIFRASIYKDNLNIFLGNYKSEVEAASAYDIAATYLHKEFARLNNSGFPLDHVKNVNRNINKFIMEYKSY